MSQKRRTILSATFVAILLSCLVSSAHGQLPVVRLHGIFPAGAKAGMEIEVGISGLDLDNVSKLRFSNPAITATQLLDPEGKPVPARFKINVPADASPGTYSVRAIGYFGISNPRLFDISDVDEFVSPSGNHSIETATEVAMNTVVNGHCDPRAEDHFKFKASKGQRIIINCRAQRIDSMVDATLTLYDSTGKKIAYSRDANRLDPLIDFTAESDSDYIVKIHDFTFGGGTNHFYRLCISDRPFVDFVFPPMARPGTTSSVTLFGRNLPDGKPCGKTIDGKPLEKLDIQIDVPAGSNELTKLSPDPFVHPREAFQDGFVYRHQSPAGQSNARAIYFATEPIVTEVEPNNSPEESQVIEVPCEFAGQFDTIGDRDFLRFNAKKDESYVMHLLSDRLGIAADPAILVQKIDDKGNVSDIAFVEDDAANSGINQYPIASHDPVYTFKAPHDGQFQLVVRNHYTDAQADPRSIYRLVIRKAKPDFRLLVSASGEQHPTNGNAILINTPLLRKTDMQILNVIARRRDGFNEAIELSVNGLPANVTALPATIPAGKSNAELLILSNDQVMDWSGTVEIIGSAKIDSGTVERTARPLTTLWDAPDRNNNPLYPRLAHEFAFAVKSDEAAPLMIDAGDKRQFETKHDGKIEIPIKLVHADNIKGDMQLSPVGLPGKHEPIKFEAKDKWKDSSFTAEIAKAAVPPGTHVFHLAGNAKVAYRANVPAADAAAATVAKLKEEIKQLEAAVKARDESAPAKLEAAKAKLAPAEAIAKQTSERAKPRDIDVRIRSLPITLVVAAPPEPEKK